MTLLLRRSPAFRWLHLAALSGFAVAQPLFDLLGRTPEFFVVRDSTRLDLFVLAAALVVLPPTALLLVQLLAGLGSRRVRDALHLLALAFLGGLLAVQALKRIDTLPLTAILAGAVALGAAGAAAYAYSRVAQSILTVLASTPLLFAALFLIRSPVAALDATDVARAAPPVRSGVPVVMVVFDELPVTSLMDARRRIDRDRYPAFAALADDATWFRRATTVHEHTTEALPTLLDGRLPGAGKLPLLADHPENLFTLLGGSYRMRVFEPITQLCPEAYCPRARETFGERMRSLVDDLGIVYLHVALPKGLTRRLPSVSDTWRDFGGHGADQEPDRSTLVVANDEEVNREIGHALWEDQRAGFEAFLRAVDTSPEPTLYFLHTLLPHAPWRFLPSGGQYPNAIGIDGLEDDVWKDDPVLVTQGFQRHLLQTGFVDRLLGRLLSRLKQAGLYDRALIVVTADHGVSFLPGEHRRAITPGNIQDIAPVPLLVKEPRQQGGRIVDAEARTIDVLPTIADVLDARVTWRTDGRSLLTPGRGSGRTVVVYKRKGGKVEAPAREVRRRMDETLRRKVSVFGSGRDSLYSIGPKRALLGRRVSDLTPGSGAARAVIDGDSLLRAFDPRSPLVPSHVTGQLSDTSAALDLAVAVNGRIVATTRSFRSGGRWRFAAFVPERVLRPGRNDVELFSARSGGGRIELERLHAGDGGESYRLAQDARSIELPRGARARVVPRALRGHVEDWYFERQTIRVGGWAADVARARVPERVLVFANGRFLYAGTPGGERRDLRVASLHPSLRRSGFVFELPRRLVGDGGDVELRFFALSGGVATELSYARRFPWRSG